MAFNIEDQYQQYLYPDTMDFSNDEKQDNAPAYGTYVPQSVKKYTKPIRNKPMPQNMIKILITNKETKSNNRLLKFFMSNIDYMNNNKILFEWIIVYEDELDHYEDQGISKFPLLIDQNEQIAGTTSIMDNLRSRISSLKRGFPTTGGRKDTTEGDLKNYMLRELDGDANDDMDEDQVFADTIHQRMAAMNKARNASGQHSMRTTNPEIHDRMARDTSRNNRYNFNEPANVYQKQRNDNLEYTPPEETPRNDAPSALDIARQMKNGNADDDMMMAYWENQELTEDY